MDSNPAELAPVRPTFLGLVHLESLLTPPYFKNTVQHTYLRTFT
jgi:hypothetical protein